LKKLKNFKTCSQAARRSHDPDFVVVLETVGQRAGMTLGTRAGRERYPFLNLD
jgi:hypothetical protein